MTADQRFLPDAADFLRAAIQDAGGNEVFALGFLDEDGLVEHLRILARGTEDTVLVIPDNLEDGNILVHNHPSGVLVPSQADLSASAAWAKSGLGSYIVDNTVEHVYVVVEPLLSAAIRPLDSKKLQKILANGGAASRHLEHYEARDSQLDLLGMIADAFNDSAVLAAEAGTGTGKSFAYLIPALSWAQLNHQRVIVSTATINLQQQLFEKDIPVVKKLLGVDIKAVLLKGRSNYICFRRLEDALRDKDLFDESLQELESLAKWAKDAEHGSRSDYTGLIKDEVWSRVCSESDICLGQRCSFREDCFVMKKKREAAESKILVVNHHLLFADLAARRDGAGYEQAAVLPPSSHIVLDEAHTIESTATSFFSDDFGLLSALKALGRLYRKRRGLELGLIRELAGMSGNPELFDHLANTCDDCSEAIQSLDIRAQDMMGSEYTYRFKTNHPKSVFEGVFEKLIEFRSAVSSLGGLLRSAINALPEDAQDDSAIWEIKAQLRRLENMAETAGKFLAFDEHPRIIFWLEKRKAQKGAFWIRFCASPLEMSATLNEALFEPAASVVCLSATLTVANSFSYWLSRTGASMADKDIRIAAFQSPFPFKEAVLLAAPTDAQVPEQLSYTEYVNRMTCSLIQSAGGSALVLFTSYAALLSAWEYNRPLFEGSGIRLLRQGDDDRARLMQSFLQDTHSVLFATDSFWEGIDAPGDTLRLVVLCRLPFRSPNDPVFEARCEALEKKGGNAFMELSLPEAVMKFKQGFGRLLRRSTDSGAVVVLDGRLLKKRYGQVFVRSLPETAICFEPEDDMISRVRHFLS